MLTLATSAGLLDERSLRGLALEASREAMYQAHKWLDAQPESSMTSREREITRTELDLADTALNTIAEGVTGQLTPTEASNLVEIEVGSLYRLMSIHRLRSVIVNALESVTYAFATLDPIDIREAVRMADGALMASSEAVSRRNRYQWAASIVREWAPNPPSIDALLRAYSGAR
jgi:hypothetical protein